MGRRVEKKNMRQYSMFPAAGSRNCSEYVSIDVYNAAHQHPYVSASCHSYVYMQTETYADDIRSSFLHGASSVDKQVGIDVPRCDVHVDGVRCRAIEDIPQRFRLFCTQASMGLPLIVAMQGTGMAYYDMVRCDRLCIDMWHNTLILTKSLCTPTNIILTVTVVVNVANDETCFCFVHRDETKTTRFVV